MTGFVLIDKPSGPTSHDIVATVRRRLGRRRVGHAGTLDPLASGLLVLAVGPATRLLRFVQDQPKTYLVTACLGTRTSTYDAQGDVTERRPVQVLADDVREAVSGYVGDIEQVPPAVSAVKIDGERAYKRARRGETVRPEPRRVTVHAFDVVRTSATAFDAVVRCSSGTYVRSLVDDVGQTLGCGAHVAALRRTAIGSTEVTAAVAPEAVTPDTLHDPADVIGLPDLTLEPSAASRAANGVAVAADVPAGPVIVRDAERVIGVFEASDGMLRPVTVLGPDT